jgi:hypothetical protein
VVPAAGAYAGDGAMVAAVRESDGRRVLLSGGSFRPTDEPALPEGSVRVRGPGRHGATWKTGMALTGVGWALAIGGAVLAVTGFDRSLNGCKLFEACGRPSDPVGTNMFIGGTVISVAGDLLTIIGPVLATVGARQRPEELR